MSFTRPLIAAADGRPDGPRLIGFCGILLCFIITNTALAQATNESSTANAAAGSGSSNIEIIKLEWKREVRLPRNFDPSVIPTGGTFNDPAARISSTAATSTESARASGPRGGTDSAGGTFPATPSRLPVFYVYSMKIKNVGPKRIEGVAWDYIFIDQNLNAEVG